MHHELEEIIRLVDDSSFSHAARMISIKKEAQTLLKKLEDQAAQAGKANVPQTGNTLQKPHTPQAGIPAK